ncbi:Protocadherin alpha-9, partial [Dissostichus eleginoides]
VPGPAPGPPALMNSDNTYNWTNLHGGSQQQRKRQSAGESARSSEMALFCTFNLSCAPVPRLALCGSP